MDKVIVDELTNPGDYMVEGQINIVTRAKDGKLYSMVLLFDLTSLTEETVLGASSPHFTADGTVQLSRAREVLYDPDYIRRNP